MSKIKKNSRIAGVTMEREIEPELKATWEKRLANEGMPEELPSELSEIIDSSHSAVSAVRALQALRQHEGSLSWDTGQHTAFVSALSNKFGLSEGEAQELLDDAVQYQQREFMERGAWGRR